MGAGRPNSEVTVIIQGGSDPGLKIGRSGQILRREATKFAQEVNSIVWSKENNPG